MNMPLAAALVFPALMILAGLGDLRTMRISNRIILALAAGYVVAAIAAEVALREILVALAVAAAVFLLGFAAFCLRWMGGGDVKLLTVAALWLGASHVVPFIFYTSIFGAALTASVIAFRRLHLPAAWLELGWINRLHQPDTGVPYGVAIGAAGVVVYPGTPWLAGWS